MTTLVSDEEFVAFYIPWALRGFGTRPNTSINDKPSTGPCSSAIGHHSKKTVSGHGDGLGTCEEGPLRLDIRALSAPLRFGIAACWEMSR